MIHKLFIRSFLVLTLLSSSVCTLVAQKYNFYFPEANKLLPQQFVYAMCTDYQGYLWVGTGEGLVKFDGTRISPVKVGNQSSTVFCTALQSNGKQIVAGFFDGTIAVGAENQLQSLKKGAESKIVSIVSVGTRIFVGSQTEVYELVGTTLKLVYKLPNGASLYHLSGDEGNDLIMATGSGLYHLTIASKKVVQLDNRPFNASYKNGEGVYVLSDSAVYVLANKKLNLLYKPKAGSFLPGNPIAVSRDGYLYVTIENRLLELDPKSKAQKLRNEFPIDGDELSVKAICTNTGQLWLGTYGNGLAYFNPQTWSSYNSTVKQDGATVALLKGKSGFIEVTPAKVNFYSTNNLGYPNLPASQSISISGTASSAVLSGSDKFLIGTQSGKVLSVNTQTRKIESNAISAQLPGKPVLAVNVDKNSIYVCVAFNGVFVFDLQGRLIKHYNTENGLLHNDIFKVFTDRDGLTWFVSRSSGLAVLDNGEFQYLTLRDGLSSLEFTDICQDNTGTVWLSTEGGGLTSVSKGQIQSYNMESGLSSDYFYGIGSADSVVFTYSRGSINILVGNSLRKIDSREIGISPNFTPRSLAIGNNWIAIGSEYGPVIQYLDQVFLENSLKLLVKKVLVNDEKRYDANTDFGYGDFKMEFRVEQINLDPFFQPLVEFKLEGHDKEWQILDEQSVIYQSIKDNEYNFVVRDKLSPDQRFAFHFSVDKPFWKKPIYYVLGLIAIVLIIYLIFKIRLKQLRERNKELEQKVSERTIELRKKNTELEQFTFAMSHDLKNPAINIVELVRLLKDLSPQYDDMTAEVIGQLSSVSTKMLNNLLDLIELLKFANTQELPKELVSIPDMVEYVKEGINQSIKEANARIELDLGAFDKVEFNRSNFQSVFQNLISNAVKYRKPGVDAHIEIKTFILEGRPAISVKDNGLGMDLEANKERLFGIFQRLHHHVEGSGIGLHLVKSIMEKHGGEIRVKSSPGEGTTFTLLFAQR